MTEHKGFILYMDNKPFFTEVELEDAGRLICGIFEYKETGIPPDFSDNPFLKAAFIAIKLSLDRDDEKYQKRCAKNRENIQKRWAREEAKKDDTNVYDPIRTYTKDTDIDTDKGTDTGIDTGNVTGKGIGIDIPSLDEVKAYAREIGFADAARFFEYYTALGWKTKGDPVTDWKALMRSWKENDKKPQKNKFSNFPERKQDFDELERKAIQKTLEWQADPEFEAELERIRSG